MAAFLVNGDAVIDILADRIGLDVVKQAATKTGGLTALNRLTNHGKCGETRVGHQQRVLHSRFLAGCAQFTKTANAKPHCRRVVPVAR